MGDKAGSKRWTWLTAVIGGAAVAVVCFAARFPATASMSMPPVVAKARQLRVLASNDTPHKATIDLPPAIRQVETDYVKAYQDGDCDTIVALTAWMQNRLERVRLQAKSPGDTARVREELCGRVLSRPIEGNHLRAEGIEDKYVLTPSAQVQVVGADDGADDLSEPVAKRVWLEIRYPTRDRALRDERGRPISSIRVGINVSPDGYVIKAGVVGTLELDMRSVSYNWPTG